MEYVSWLRGRIGSRKTILVYATVVAQDEAGRVLLQRRSDFDWWGLPGGVLERGEDLEGCARRELREETGLEVGALRLVGLYSAPAYDVAYPNGDQAQQFTVCFAGRLAGGSARPDGHEILGLEMLAEAELAGRAISPWYRAMLADTFHAADVAYDTPLGEGRVVRIPPEWALPGAILAAAVAVVADEDGRVYMPADGAGQRRFPVRPVRLGETAADAALRAVGRLGEVRLERLLGLAAGVALPVGSGPVGEDQPAVAAVFLLRARRGGNPNDASQWLTREALARATATRDDWTAELSAALDGGHFVAGRVQAAEADRGPGDQH